MLIENDFSMHQDYFEMENGHPLHSCWKKAYSRGRGLIPKKCPPNQEHKGKKCFDMCDAGYYAEGDICWRRCPKGFTPSGHNAHLCFKPNKAGPCPSGMKDLGISCMKNFYGRSVGQVPPKCPFGLEYDAGLCYNSCKQGTFGIGPVCTGTCPPGTSSCGMLCLRGGVSCDTLSTKAFIPFLKLVIDAATFNLPNTELDVSEFAQGF